MFAQQSGVAAAVSITHASHTLFNDKVYIICQIVKKRDYISDFFCSTVKNNLISNTFLYKLVDYRFDL